MPERKSPRRGSLQYWPRKRAKRIYPRTSSWPSIKDILPLGFAGFKAGMTQVVCNEDGKPVVKPATVIDAPPLFVCGIRFYSSSENGFVVLGEEWKIPKDFKKDLQRKTLPGKKEFDTEKNIEKIADVRLIVASQPRKSGMKKKKPDVFEIAVGGEDVKKKIEYAKSLLGKEISVNDVFKPGEYIDVSAVTKGHGFTGPVKRFGIKIQGRKNEQHHRHVGSIGSVVPRKVDWRVPAAGQYGFHTRTELNKRVLGIFTGDELSKINPKGGFQGYGLVKETAILIEGSVPGPRKRLIRLRKAIRGNKKPAPLEIKQVVV